MRRLSVVHVSTFDLAGGAEKVAWKLHNRLREAGHSSLLVVGCKLSDDPDVLEVDNAGRGRGPWRLLKVQLESRLGREYLDFPGSHRIPELVGRSWDVTHAHNLHGGYFDLAALPRLTRLTPTILTLQDMWLLTGHCAHSLGCGRWRTGCGACPDLTIYPAVPRDGTATNHRRKRRLLAGLDLHLATPGRWLLEVVQESYLAGRPIRHIPNLVDTSVFRPGDKAAARAALGLPSDRPIVFLPARLAFSNQWKNARMLDEAVRALADLRVLGLAFGDADDRSRDDLWIVPATVDESLVAEIHRAADVVISPSRADTSPLAILEAFATARPVVATRVGGIPELVEEGRNGLLVEPDDASGFAAALRTILTSPEDAARLGAEGLAGVPGRFDLDHVASVWLDWYAELADSSRRERR